MLVYTGLMCHMVTYGHGPPKFAYNPVSVSLSPHISFTVNQGPLAVLSYISHVGMSEVGIPGNSPRFSLCSYYLLTSVHSRLRLECRTHPSAAISVSAQRGVTL